MMGVIMTTLISLIIANTIDLKEIAIIGSAGFLLIFSLVNISAYKLHLQIKGNKILIMISSAVSLLSLLTLLGHTYTKDPKAIVVFVLFIVLSIGFEYFYGKYVRGHFFNRRYK